MGKCLIWFSTGSHYTVVLRSTFAALRSTVYGFQDTEAAPLVS